MLRAAFVCAILAAGLPLAVVNRFAALLLYVWLALFRPLEWIWLDLAWLRPSLLAGIVLVVPALATGVFPAVRHPMGIGALLFLAAAGAAHFTAIAPDISLQWLDYLGRLVVITLFAIRIVSTPRQFAILLAVVAGSFGFHSAKGGLMSALGGGVRYYHGPAGAFIDNNGYAVGAAMILFLLLATAQTLALRPVRAGWYLAALFSALTIVSTFSRSGFLAMAAGSIVFVLLQRRKLLALGATTALLGPLLLVAPLPDGYESRISTIQTYEEDSDRSALGRQHFWRVAVAMAEAHPFGVGLRNYEVLYDEFDTSGGAFGSHRSVHSSHLEVLAETGLIGAAVYCSMFVYAFVLGFRIRTRAKLPHLAPHDARLFFSAANGLLAAMVAFLVGGAFIAMALNDLTWIIFALMAALDRITLRVCASEAPVRATETVAAPQATRPVVSPPAWSPS